MSLSNQHQFKKRHLGLNGTDAASMLKVIGYSKIENLMQEAIPESIALNKELNLKKGISETQSLATLKQYASENKVNKSFIGLGYYDTVTPPPIQRNILENPGWYTAYTPYQAEISQGRMEALLNFQTMVMDLTAMEVANASLLDEGTAVAEAMSLCLSSASRSIKDPCFFIDEDCLPQTIDVVTTRANYIGVKIVIGNCEETDFSKLQLIGGVLQYPGCSGRVVDISKSIKKLHDHNALAVVAADILALTVLTPPGELGADIAVGSTQRFGVPMMYGGPHAAYMACKDTYKRNMPGRFIGVSKDRSGRLAYRMALQTREQHIRREKATSNICTAQVLLGVMASMYAVYHGPQGLKNIALGIHRRAAGFAENAKRLGINVINDAFFDTIQIEIKEAETIYKKLLKAGINVAKMDGNILQLAFDETKTWEDVAEVLSIIANSSLTAKDIQSDYPLMIPESLLRSSDYLTHEVFNRYHTETELMRYMHKLESKDLTLNASMIPLGSCTMKLNATAELMPVSWPEFASIHPFAPLDQTKGYQKLINELAEDLSEITGFAKVSLQPNAGSQGEFAGLLVIKKYQESRGETNRNICLIPSSAHGTNPASAVMAGMKVVVVKCDDHGNIDLNDLKAKCETYKDTLAALMVTYPSTHGVFESAIKEICEMIHTYGGQVYMDGANMNAMVAYSKPGEFGADVSHLNLHKTFAIPHGGGGPGVGPIGVVEHLAPFLPNHAVIKEAGPDSGVGAISAAPWGSAGILPISWSYIKLMGSDGLKEATSTAILSANYIAKKLSPYYPVLYTAKNGLVAHECIIDLRPFKKTAGVDVDDIAKRLMDYGFHAPTMSFPVAGTLMIEPTESESLAELDRFCEAMICIANEIKEVEEGKADKANNVLKNAPHSMYTVCSDSWDFPYSREKAAFPVEGLKQFKYWTTVDRVDNAYGDRHFMCSCPPVDSYS